MSATTRPTATKRKTLLLKFKDDTVTTVSHETFSEVARTLGFNETQTLHFAIARLRDEILKGGRAGSGGGEEPYPPLTAGQLLDIRSQAPKPRGKPVRKESSSAISELKKAARPKAVDMTPRSAGRKKTTP